MAVLLTALRIQTLSTKSEKGVMEEYGESNMDDVQEGVMEMMIKLVEVSGDLLGVNAASKENGGMMETQTKITMGPLLPFHNFLSTS